MKNLLAILLSCSLLQAKAQRNEIYDDRIASLQVVAGTDWLSPPVVELNGGRQNVPLNISFDDLTHTYHRYTYKIEHCQANWTVSDQLFQSDYLEGFAEGNTIDDVTESFNTNQLYTHYRIRIPNDNCCMKMSGNYKLTVIDDNDDGRPMLTACFMVVERQMGVSLQISTNTDIDINGRHQQVGMAVDYGQLRVTQPDEQLKTVVMQNGRWDNAVVNASPQYRMATGLRWDHNRSLIFEAGNEYHKYEVLDVNYPTMGIDRIHWDGKIYNVYPYISEPRPNYLYDEDANGAFYIRNSDNVDNDTQSEYVMVHYRMKCPQPVSGNVYVDGVWTNNSLSDRYLMTYNMIDRQYEAGIWQKQGYYSYHYVMVDDNGKSRVVPSEGSFFQTENQYQALVYYRGLGDRTDRLVGYQQVKTKF